mmetsp:Transcript_21631/g.66197  ORF Transcript_21631/g.66197 Transcript_21631/m.66197 type:complete len:209 (-) Transcript_21631:726-1352(-)
MKAAEAALLELHALHGIEFADIPHVLLVPPGLLQPLDVVVVRLRVLNPAEDGLVLVCDLLELPLAALTVQRGMALSPLSPHAGAVGSDSDSCGSLHAGALVPLGKRGQWETLGESCTRETGGDDPTLLRNAGAYLHDVRHLLEEQAVLALDGGVALLQQRLLLSIALQMTLRRGRLVVDGALHVPQLRWYGGNDCVSTYGEHVCARAR